MNNYKLGTITLLIFSISALSGSDAQFKKLSFVEKITRLTGSPVAVAQIVVAYSGFFKITGKGQMCYDRYPHKEFNPDSYYYSKQHKKNPSTYFTASDNKCIYRNRVYWPLASDTALVFRSTFNLETFSISHDDDADTSPVDIASQKTNQTKVETNDIRDIVGENIVPKGLETAALISRDKSKLIVFEPPSTWQPASGFQQWAKSQTDEREFGPCIFVYPIDYNDTKPSKSSSCCSIN